MRREGSVREKMLETSKFLGREGGGPEIREMENDDGESCDPAGSADVARQSLVECLSFKKASSVDGSCAQSSSVFHPSNPARRAETVWVSFWTLVLRNKVCIASVPRAQPARHLFASESRRKRALTEKGTEEWLWGAVLTLRTKVAVIFFASVSSETLREWRRRGGEEDKHVGRRW